MDMIKPYAIVIVPDHDMSPVVGFSLRDVISQLDDDPEECNGYFEVFYQDGREKLVFGAPEICHGDSEPFDGVKERLIESAKISYDNSQTNLAWDEEFKARMADSIETWRRWASGGLTDDEVERQREKSNLSWMSPAELDTWESGHIEEYKGGRAQSVRRIRC